MLLSFDINDNLLFPSGDFSDCFIRSTTPFVADCSEKKDVRDLEANGFYISIQKSLSQF